MPSTRKTMTVERLVQKANAMLAASNPERVAERNGVIGFIESVLNETGNYRGFSYLRSQWNEDESGLREDYDDTRRRYF